MDLIKKILTGAMAGQLSKLDDLHLRHTGEECYLFGSGISLKWMDLSNFADRPSILGNFAVYHKEAAALNAPYCAIIEPCFFWPFFPYSGAGKFRLIRHHIYEEFRETIAAAPRTTFFVNFSNYPVARFCNAIYVSRFYAPPFPDRNPFRDRPDSHDGTLKFQISLAIYLGFKKAYLVGHDYTHSPARTLHFYEKGRGQLAGDMDFSPDFLSYARKQIELVTVTLEGGSRTLDSVTYERLTGKAPVFRENLEIVERRKLENLATWKDYSIF
ncbi:MAG TPA: hypothetical protein PK523_10550 [Elusimicrobiales bacterium]|nr:hypothetical protein [Elusimicrobiales bacterium]